MMRELVTNKLQQKHCRQRYWYRTTPLRPIQRFLFSYLVLLSLMMSPLGFSIEKVEVTYMPDLSKLEAIVTAMEANGENADIDFISAVEHELGMGLPAPAYSHLLNRIAVIKSNVLTSQQSKHIANEKRHNFQAQLSSKSTKFLTPNASASGGIESTPPVLNSISVDRVSVDVGQSPQTITWTVDATDESGIGWSSTGLFLRDSGGGSKFISGDNADPGRLVWEVDSNVKRGIWEHGFLQLRDNNGNTETYFSLVNEFGLPATIEVLGGIESTPDAPTIDSIEPGNAQATVSFTPGEDNGSPITGYRYIKDNGVVSSPDFATTGSSPYGIATDGDGNVYTANGGSNTVSKIAPDGTTTTLGTTGAGPRGIAVDTDGNVYTSNLDASTVSKITPDGTSTIVGTTGLKPRGIAVDTDGNVYTANTDSETVSKITPAGASTIFGTTGNTPVAIAIDANGNVYTANVDSDTVSKITAGGISTILGVTGSGPVDITVDADGNVYTANQASDDVSKIAPDGTTTTLGTTGAGPRGIALDAAGNIYTANRATDNVSKITAEGISAILGVTGSGPRGIAVDADGNVYTSSTSSNTLSKITDTSTATFAATGDTSPITITGLINDTEYLMSLIAVNDAGESAASNSVSVTPEAPTEPDAPTIDSIAAGDGQVVIAVTPGADNGLPITGYTALCLNTISDSSIVSSLASPITVSGLNNGVSYVCAVSATNDAGTSQGSEASSVTPAGDVDGDGVNDLLDNCVSIANPGQEPSAINPNCGEACVTSSCAGTICVNH
jgi:streptogramin lyase